MFNDLFQIEPLEKRDFGLYSCLFVDEYGEKKLQFKIDEKLVRDENVAYLDGHHLIESKTNSPIASEGRVVARMADLIIDVSPIKNVKNRIKIICRNQFGK